MKCISDPLGYYPCQIIFTQPPNLVSIISHYSGKYSFLKFLGSLFSDFRRSVKFKNSKYPAIIALLYLLDDHINIWFRRAPTNLIRARMTNRPDLSRNVATTMAQFTQPLLSVVPPLSWDSCTCLKRKM